MAAQFTNEAAQNRPFIGFARIQTLTGAGTEMARIVRCCPASSLTAPPETASRRPPVARPIGCRRVAPRWPQRVQRARWRIMSLDALLRSPEPVGWR
jgi:hypothetical protein